MNSVTIECPAKLILFGEWSVLHGSPALACTLGKYFSLKYQSQEANGALSSIVWNDDSPKNPLPSYTHNFTSDVNQLWAKAQSFVELLFPKSFFESKKILMTLSRNWPLFEGGGSSSALGVCLIYLKHSLLPNSKEPNSLSDSFFAQEGDFQKLISFEGGSGVDFASQWLGKTILYSRNLQEKKFDLKNIEIQYPKELCLIHTKKKINTRQMLATFQPTSSQIRSIQTSVEKFITSHDWEEAIHKHFEIFSNTVVCPEEINHIHDELKSLKLLSALKTTGAGGGDALLCLLSSENKISELQSWCHERNYSLTRPKFAVEGVKQL